MSTKTKIYQFTGGVVTNKQLEEILKGYVPNTDAAEIVSWIEATDTGIKIYMKDGSSEEITISQAKEFETVEYDKDTCYLHFYDANGADVYDPVYIEGGGGGTASSSVVKLTNQNGTATFAIATGTSLNLMFNFTSTEDDIATGDGTCQITVNGVVKYTSSIKQGLTTIDVSKYLVNGSNTVRVKCTDVYGNYKTLIYTVSVIDLYITSTFDDTVAYSSDITYKYTPYGSIEKTIHILVDGTEVNSTVVSTSGKQITQNLASMAHGVHRLEVYATATLNDTEMESEHLVYDVMFIEDNNTSSMISSVFNVTSVKQGEQISIPYIVHDPTKLACDISLDIYTMSSGSEVSYSTQNLTVDRERQYWNTRKYPVGTVYFRIKYGDIYKVHIVEVTESDIQLKPETNDLELELLSDGRSNNEPNPAVWTYGSYATTFSNFNWKTNGWVDDENGDTCLRLTGDARAEIQFKPFESDFKTYGKTIELEFAIRDVNSRDDVVISCMSGDKGFEVKADTAYIKSEQSTVFCKYKDEDKVKLAFVAESTAEYRILSVYLNGVLSDTIQYPLSDNFQQTEPVNISIGSSKCGIDLYGIRSYSTASTSVNNVNNFIADIDDIIEKTEAYERNDIYDEYGKISFEKCKKKNSVMVIVGDLPQAKGDKKTVTVNYYDVDDPSINFTDENVTIDIQGTSSQFYARKNWKHKYSENRYIDKEHLPAKVICIKVDYAEATGTHNTQNANFVETLYSEKIPPQETDPLCRTTIYGKPIVLFHQTDANSEPTFYAKANYNYDKGAEYVFGFTSDYDVECWEFCNNTSNACNFLDEIPIKWTDDFEARYPEGSTDIMRFKEMHDWVVSTRQDTATGNALNSAFTDANGNKYTNDTAEYRLAKFKMEFEDHFNMHYSLIYYVYTFFALMVDQRAKNMFLTYWGSTGKWYPYFYDNDTSFGINNEGQLVFDYYHEDTDTLEGANVYNGQNSVLWVNFREAFPDKIKETYQKLRNDGLITYEKLVNQFIANGSDKWSESIYNEDSDFKYVTMLRSDNDATNLPQVRGTGEEHFRYFIENRLNYCDSKWYAAAYANDYVSLRIYTPSEWSGVEPSPAITVTPFSDMYTGVRYKANGTLYQKRVTHGETVTFRPQGETFESENNETFNDTETAIYGAHQLSSIGDLAPLYCGSINVSNADKLIELKIGDSTEGYSNTNLRELSVGTNKLLKKLDVRNCPNLAIALGLSGCPSIEEVYATGTSITGVEFTEAGCLKIVHLPATIANLTLKHQLDIEDLTIVGYDNIKTLWIENCPTINVADILAKCTNVERVRITDVSWEFDTSAEMLELAARTGIGGIDENGMNINTMWIDGSCHIGTLTGAEYLEIKAAFPYMTITYDVLTSELIFMSEDGSTELTRQTIQNGGNGTDPVSTGTINTPTKTSTAQYHYTFAGWSLTAGGSASSTALNSVEADRKVYVAFTSTIRSYTVRFYNGSTLLQTSTVEYGKNATYTGSTPLNNSTGNTDDFEFYGWSPSPTNIQKDTNCYAQFHDLREITDSWATIAANCSAGTGESKYSVGAFKTLNIGEKVLPYNFYYGSAVVFNDEIHILGSSGGSSTKHYKWNGTEWTSVSTLPYDFYRGSAVVYNDEIHILGGYGSITKHYKWNGTEWISVSTLPYSFYRGSAVVYNDEIHILGSDGSSSVYEAHYKWNGTEWISVSTLPYSFYRGSAVVYNDEIHILGTYYPIFRTAHYKWNGTEWTEVSTLPYDFYDGSAVVFNDEIHILGSSGGSSTKHYKWNGTDGWSMNYVDEIIKMLLAAHNHDELPDGVLKWTSVSTLPYDFKQGSAVVYNDEIHILGGSAGSTKHYKWNGTEWTSVSTLPYRFYNASAVVFNDEIHILGSYDSSYYTKHYKWNGTEWTSISTLPCDFRDGSAVVFNDEIHILSYTKHYKWNGTEWTEVSTLPYSFYYGSAVVYNDEIHILGSANSSSYTKHYKWNPTDEWTEVSTLPYNFKQGSAVVFNDEIHILGGSADSTKHYKWNGTEWTSVSTLPYSFYNGSAVVYNDEIHILGSNDQSKGFFKLTGPSWESESNVGFNFLGNSVVYNDEINILGGDKTRYLHNKWNPTDGWTEVSTLPYNFYDGSAVVYNDEIHILGGYSNITKHYKWNGTEWISVSTLPYSFYRGSAVVYNDEIHIFGNGAGITNHCKWNGTEWISVSTLPYDFKQGSAVVYNDEIHILGGSAGSTKHYKWNGTEWTEVSTLPYNFYEGSAVVYNDEIHIISSGNSSYFTAHYKWNPTDGWVSVHSLFSTNILCSAVVYRNRIHSFHSGTHYALHNPRATLTFIAEILLKDARTMNSTATNVGGWSASELREYLNGDFISTLPSDLQTALSEVKKLSDSGYNSDGLMISNDKVWILSWNEISDESLANVVNGQGTVYPSFTDKESRIRNNSDGSITSYILRSSRRNSNTQFVSINANGYSEFIDANTSRGILIGFCI